MARKSIFGRKLHKAGRKKLKTERWKRDFSGYELIQVERPGILKVTAQIIDIEHIEKLREELTDYLQKHDYTKYPIISLDMSEVRRISSDSTGVFYSIYRESKKKNTKFQLIGLSSDSEPRQLIQMQRLEYLLAN